MIRAADIEFVQSIPGGIEIHIRGDYPEPMSASRTRATIELDWAAAAFLAERITKEIEEGRP